VQAFRGFRWVSVYWLATYLINPRNTTGTKAFFSALSVMDLPSPARFKAWQTETFP